MSGKKITNNQVKIYMNARSNKHSQSTAAAKAGFCERTGRRIEKSDSDDKSQREWKTRKDPFENVWETEITPLLQEYPRLQAKTILFQLQKTHRGKYPDSQLRTLQRRVAQWRAIKGPKKSVMFSQEHPSGWQSLSDFTAGAKLEITINGVPFDHLLYHFRLACSGWEHAEVVLGGESFTALSECLQNSVYSAGGVTETHRTDSLSAAYKNLPDKSKEEFTKRYEQLCSDLGMKPTRNNKGVSHENGTIEVSHFHLKSTIEQHLMLRGSKDFKSIAEYRSFIQEIIDLHNERIEPDFKEELPHLKALPEHRSCDFDEIYPIVSKFSTIRVKNVPYSVPSQLIGQTLKVHLYDDRLKCFFGAEMICELPRLRYRGKEGRIRAINYRHLIHSLVRKPGAFRNYVYKDHFFPTLAFRQAWEVLDHQLDNYTACREYLTILEKAAENENENLVNQYLEECIMSNTLPLSAEVKNLFRKPLKELPKDKIQEPDLNKYTDF